MGKPRAHLPTLAGRKSSSATCIDVNDTSRNHSVSSYTSNIFTTTRVHSTVSSEHTRQPLSSSLTVTTDSESLGTSLPYRTTTPRRYEDWLPVKDHLIFIPPGESELNAYFRTQQEEHFVKLHFNLTGQTVVPNWTTIPPIDDHSDLNICKQPSVPVIEHISSIEYIEFADEYVEPINEAPFEVPAYTFEPSLESPDPTCVTSFEHHDQCLELENPISTVENVEDKFESIDRITSMRASTLSGSSAATIQHDDQDYHHYCSPCDESKGVSISTGVEYNYKKRRRR